MNQKKNHLLVFDDKILIFDSLNILKVHITNLAIKSGFQVHNSHFYALCKESKVDLKIAKTRPVCEFDEEDQLIDSFDLVYEEYETNTTASLLQSGLYLFDLRQIEKELKFV